MSISTLPEWLGAALIAASFATIGFLGRKLLDMADSRRKKRDYAIQELERLKVLLNDARSVFKNQNYLVQRLMVLIQIRTDKHQSGLGYDETFFRMRDSMNDEEQELFNLIRGTTINSMNRLNNELLSWANTHTAKQLLGHSSSKIDPVDAQLSLLRMHLNVWFDKYESVFKTSEYRSLVYLADEKSQGISFPVELSQAVEDLLKDLK